MLLKAFMNHIATHFPFLVGKNLLIACSGGLDSMVLVNLCNAIDVSIGVAHCNFMLRGDESDADASLVKIISERATIPFFIKEFETQAYAKNNHLSIQMAARNLRYSWFKELALEYQYDYVLTAHHADDNLETFLINLSRGTGIDGLIGIPEINDIFIRPLLPFSRDQIFEYAQKNKLEWREDKSNTDTKYLRNAFRHKILPELKTITPHFLSSFNTTIQHLRHSNTIIKNYIDTLKKEIFECDEYGFITISIDKLCTIDDSEGVVYFLLKDYGFKAWDDIHQIMKGQSGKQVFSETHRLVKNRNHLLLSPIPKERLDHEYVVVEEENMLMIPLGTLKIKEVDEVLEKNLKTIYVDKDTLKYPLVVRKWREGDYFYPIGMKGKKKLSKYFKDEKLSLLAKERVWVLCSEEKIVWIINYRADDRYKITPATKQVLQIMIL